MSHILVVYYSLSGNTQKVAEAIASACDADIEVIADVKSRSGALGYLRSIREALTKRLVDIQPVNKDPSQYDLLILGTPVWAGNISSPLRSYIEQQKNKFNQVAFFCTQGSSGADKVLQKMTELSAKEPAATLVLNDREIQKQAYDESLQKFVSLLPLRHHQIKSAV